MLHISVEGKTIAIVLSEPNDISQLLRRSRFLLRAIRLHRYTLLLDFKELQILAKSKLASYNCFFHLCGDLSPDRVSVLASNAILCSQVRKMAQEAGLSNLDVFNLSSDAVRTR